MSSEKTDAIVIRQADFSESSRVVTFFTRDWGKISALAKGARRLKGPFEAALDLLTVCRIVFLRKSSSSLDILTEAQLISRFWPRQTNLASLYGGYYVAELLAGLTEEYDPHPQLYDEAVAALGRLAADDNPHSAVIRFELATLREIGQLPDFSACLRCGRPTSSGGPFVFWVQQSGMLCPACQQSKYNQRPIPSGTLVLLDHLTGDHTAISNHLSISPQQLQELRHITTAAISHVMGRRPKMLRYLNG